MAVPCGVITLRGARETRPNVPFSTGGGLGYNSRLSVDSLGRSPSSRPHLLARHRSAFRASHVLPIMAKLRARSLRSLCAGEDSNLHTLAGSTTSR